MHTLPCVYGLNAETEVFPLDKKRMKIIWVLYLLGAYFLLFGRSPMVSQLPYLEQLRLHMNLRPFLTVSRYLRLLQEPYRQRFLHLALRNLVGNFFLFLPLGYFLPLRLPSINRFWKMLLAGLLILLCVELLQLVLLIGFFDVDDILLNLCGICLGYSLYFAANKTHRMR